MGFLFVMGLYFYITYIAYSYLFYRKYYSDILLETEEKSKDYNYSENNS